MAKYEKYTLAVGEKAAERLQILNRVCNPYTFSFLDRLDDLQGKHILDIGCGTGIMACELANRAGPTGKVLAIDISEEQIALAKDYALRSGVKNIEFHVLPADKIDTLQSSFDFIYCRFLLMHLAEPLSVITNIVSKLRKNGTLFCEECNDYDSMFSYPESDAFNGWKSMCLKQSQVHHTDINIGKKLFSYFKQQGLNEIKTNIAFPLIFTEDEKNLLWMGMQEIMPAYVKAGLTTEEEMLKLIQALKQFAKEDHLVGMVQYMQVSGTST